MITIVRFAIISLRQISTSNTSNQTSIIQSSSLLQTPWPLVILVWFEIVSGSLIYAFGYLGNLLSLIIFYGENEFRTVSTGILFCLITIFNSIHLWTLTTEFLGNFNILIFANEFLQCRLAFFVQNTSRSMSTFLALTISIDRFIRSEYPIQSRKICTSRNMIRLTIVYLILFSILFSFWFCPMNQIHPILKICYTGESIIYNMFINQIYFPGRFVLVCVVPVIGMIVTNIRVLTNLQRSRRRVRNVSQTSDVTVPEVNGTNSLDRLLLIMMLVNITTFLLTQTPFHISMMIRAYGSLNAEMYLLIRPLMLIWSSIYFGIGFYTYCLATPLFRKRSKKILLKILPFRRV